MARLTDIEGIGFKYASTLAEKAGLRTTEELLQAGGTAKGREKLAEVTGVAGSLILDWVNRADLMRIKGIGEGYSDLLEVAGVDTVKELSNRSPEALQKKLVEINLSRRLVRRVPSLREVASWVEQARELPPMVSY